VVSAFGTSILGWIYQATGTTKTILIVGAVVFFIVSCLIVLSTRNIGKLEWESVENTKKE
jgi:hypothetical protein